MAFELPRRRIDVKQIQTQKRKVPIEQIIAVQGQSPVATGIETAGNVIGQALMRRGQLRQEGEKLAQHQANFEREMELKERQAMGGGMGRGGATGYFVPRGVDPQSGRPIYSNSKQPGLFYDDMTPYQGTAPGKLVLQTLPSEQVEKESQLSTLKLAAEKISASYDPSFVGPIASRTGKLGQAFDMTASPEKASFYGNVADLRNQLVYLRSGKQINEQEYKRLLAAMPNEGLSPIDFTQKLNNFYQLLDTIISSRQATLQGTGYRLPKLESPKPQPVPGLTGKKKSLAEKLGL